jgi:hypothetical protein
VFTVDVGGEPRVPGYQLDETGQPRAIMADILGVLGDRLPGWELALWFTGSSDWLGGARPVDVLDSDHALVGEAARRLAAEILR